MAKKKKKSEASEAPILEGAEVSQESNSEISAPLEESSEAPKVDERIPGKFRKFQ